MKGNNNAQRSPVAQLFKGAFAAKGTFGDPLRGREPVGQLPDLLHPAGQLLGVGFFQGHGLGFAQGGVVELAREGAAVGAGDAIAMEQPQVEAQLPTVGVLAGAALFGFVQHASLQVGPVDLAHQAGAAGGFGFQGELLVGPLVGNLVEQAALGYRVRLLFHPKPPQGEPGLAGTDQVVAQHHAADAEGSSRFHKGYCGF